MADFRKNNPLEENEKHASRSNQEHGMDKSIKRHKEVEGRPIAVGVDTGEEACGKTLT